MIIITTILRRDLLLTFFLNFLYVTFKHVLHLWVVFIPHTLYLISKFWRGDQLIYEAQSISILAK